MQLELEKMLDNLVLLITKEKKEEQMRSDATGSLYATLLAHIQLLKLTSSKDRNMMQAKMLV